MTAMPDPVTYSPVTYSFLRWEVYSGEFPGLGAVACEPFGGLRQHVLITDDTEVVLSGVCRDFTTGEVSDWLRLHRDVTVSVTADATGRTRRVEFRGEPIQPEGDK